MTNLIILFLIIAGLTIHRYLTSFWEQRSLPYSMGFLTFANLFIVIYLINYIWMFGWLVGIVLSALTFFQIIYSSYLWPLLLPWLIKIHKEPIIPRVNPIVYGTWSFITIGLGLLTILNFFISDYSSLLNSILELFNKNIVLLVFLIIGSMTVGNIVRFYVMKNLLK